MYSDNFDYFPEVVFLSDVLLYRDSKLLVRFTNYLIEYISREN